MAENEIGSLYISIKTDMAKLNQEIIATQAKMTSLANTVESAMQTLANTTTRTASKAVNASRDSYTEQIRYANQLNIDTEQKAVAHAEKLVATMRSAVQRQFELDDKAALSEKKKQDRMLQIASEARDKLEQREIKEKGQAEARRFAELQANEKLAQKRAEAQQNALNKINKAEEANHNKTLERISRTMTAIAAVMAARFVLGGIEQAIAMGIKFNAEMETARLGVASVISSQGEFINQSGQMATGYTKLAESMKLGDDVIKQLKVDNLSTMATLEQLIKAFQEGLAPAMAAGFNIQQVRQYTVAMVQAAGVLRINLDMMGEEVRSLVTGNINPRNSRIAMALGITPEQIRSMKEEPEKLFTYLMGRLESFKVAGIESQKTFFGLISNFKDAMGMAVGEGTQPLFDYLKKTLFEIANSIVHINQTTGEISFDPSFIKSMQEISSIAIGIANSFVMIDSMLRNINTNGGNLKPGFGIADTITGLFTGSIWTELRKKLNIAPAIADFLKEMFPSESYFADKERETATTDKFSFVPNKPFMPESLKNQIQAEIEQRYALIKASTQKEIALYRDALKTETTLIEEEYSKRNVLDVEALTQKSALKQKEISMEINALEKEKEALQANFRERADYLKNQHKYQYEPVGVFKNQEEMTKAEKAMAVQVLAIDTKLAEAQGKLYRNTIETNITLRQKQRDMDVFNLKQVLDLYSILLSRKKEEINLAVANEGISDYTAKQRNLELELQAVNKKLELAKEEQRLQIPDTEVKKAELEARISNLYEERINLGIKGEVLQAENQRQQMDNLLAMNREIEELAFNYDGILDAELAILEVEERRARLVAGDNSVNQAAIKQLYDLKTLYAYIKSEEAKISLSSRAASGAESLYSTTGQDQYITLISAFHKRVVALNKEKNDLLLLSDNERRAMDLAEEQSYTDKINQLQLTRYNKQYEAYSKLYKATGLQQYADKLVQIENQILDKEDYFNNQIVDNEQDAFRLRQIRMQEFYQSRLDMIESTGNKEIAKAKEVAEIVASFNVPLAGSNISSMTGMPIGTVGQRFGNTNYPGVWFGSQQELTDYMKNFNQTSFAGGLVKVSGPATGGSDQWFKTMQDANKFIEDWKNGLGQATTSVSNLSSAVDTLTSKFQSSYQSFQSFLTERERRNWTAADWTREFDRLVSVFNNNPDVETQINTLNSMLDVLKELDKTQQETLQTQKQIANDFLSSAKSVDELIDSLKFGPMNPGVSYGGMTTQYESLKSGATTAEGVNKFTSFIQNTYLPFMKTYGSGYFDKLDEITSDLSGISSDLKGKAAYISLAEALGINVNIKEPISPSSVFDFTTWTPEQLKIFTDSTGTGRSLFNMIGGWTAKQLNFFTDILQFSNFDGTNWHPETINLSNLMTFDFAGLFADISTGNLEGAISKTNTLIDILGGSGTDGLVGSSGSAQTQIEALIKKFTGNSSLSDSAVVSQGNLGSLIQGLYGTEDPFQDVADASVNMATKVKESVDAMESFYSALAGRVGQVFNTQTGQTATIPTKTEIQYTTKEVFAPTFLTSGSYGLGGRYAYTNPITGNLVDMGFYTAMTSPPAQVGPFIVPKAGAGALTSGLTLAGELGPEYVVPTYEPQRSNFLKTVGVDSAQIGKEIARQLASSLVTTGSNGKDIKIQLVVDGKVLSDVVANHIYNGHDGLTKNIRRLVGVK